MQPPVSVILPTYNRCASCIEAVDSIVAQTWRHFELIIVDDGSTDDTRARLDDRCAAIRDIPIRIIALDHAGMPGRTRNRGVAAAHGELIAFLDDDDLWLPKKLEQQLELHRGPNAAALSHTREIWRRGLRTISQRRQHHRRAGDIFADALRRCIIGPSTVMLNRGLFLQQGGFREDLPIAEDYELWLRITAHHQVAYLDQALTIKRGGRPDQLSTIAPQSSKTIEYWRMQALKPLVDAADFASADQLAAASAELTRKRHIYAAGRRKRCHQE